MSLKHLIRSHRSCLMSTLFALCVSASTAHADPLLEFAGSADAGGALSFAGGTLSGSNIRVGQVTGTGTAADGSHAVTGQGFPFGLLSFTTGAFQGYSGGQYTFGPGGGFEIHGDVADAGIGGSGGDALLVSGSFDEVSVGDAGAASVTLSTRASNVHVDPTLLDLFGLNSYGIFSIVGSNVASGLLGDGSGFSLDILETDFEKAEPTGLAADPVPEATSLLLLGSGLTALAAAFRRRPRKDGDPGAPRAL